jgi:hypothetical protein
MNAAALAAILALPLLAAEPASAPTPSAALASFLSDAVGADGLEILSARGYVVLQGPKGSRRAVAAHWKALERLAAASKSCWSMAAAVDAAVSTGAARGADAAACRALPPSGVATPAVRAMAGALAALREESAALSADGASFPDPDPSRNLFAKPWGRELAARAHADLLEDPAPLVRSFFDERLAGPRPDAGAVEHFVAEGAERGVAGLSAQLSSDAAKGAPSEDLKAQLRRYLVDERRRWNAQVARQELARLRKASGGELADLAAVSAPLAQRPSLLEKAEGSVARPGASGEAPRLRSAGLHLSEPARLGQHELGDEIVFSGAYWVDGLPEGKSVEMEETTFAESEAGYFAVESRRVRRANGGPYTYVRKLRLNAPGSFVARAAVGAETGGAVSERTDVAVASDFELALAKEAEAAGRRLACEPKDAESAYAALEALVAEPARVKPQYKALASRAKRAREESAKDAARLVALDELLAKARLSSSPEQCRYSTADADSALRLIAGLPAGCDQACPELTKLRHMTSRRAADHDWFLKASAEARSKRKSCDLDGAARRWTEALAVLEADPAARCGKAAEEAEAAARELADTRRELAWDAEFNSALEKADLLTGPNGRLDRARSVLARLPTLASAKCLSKTAHRALDVAQKAGADLGPAPSEDLARRLPADTTLASVAAEVRRERARLAAAAAAAARTASEAQSPSTPVPAIKVAPLAPAAEVEDAPPARVPRKAARPNKPATKRKPAPTKKPAQTEADPS